MRRILIKVLVTATGIVAIVAAWAAFDIYRPLKVDIRDFDPDEVARLDTAMWRSYYSRERIRLFREATELLEKQYHLPFWRRQLVAYYAASSAFVFKDGKSRIDYEKALPNLRNFYSEISKISIDEFDAERAAQLELEWWIIHRERAKHSPDDLAKSLAEAAAAVYYIPARHLMEYGDLRARAMKIRDEQAAAGGVSEEDWQMIDDLLHRSWRSLHTAVNSK
jgi:hypothetical protein